MNRLNADNFEVISLRNEGAYKNVKDELKIRLITLLSESLSHSVENKRTTSSHSTEDFIKKFYGAWKGPESSEEIISRINESKTCK